MAEKFEKIGTCAYCGQTRTIETIGEVSQAELDEMATDRCLCSEAQSAKRKKARRAKIDEFIKKKFITPEMVGFMQNAIKFVEDGTFEDATIKLYGSKTVKIWMDADSFLHIRIKRTEDDELKA